MDNIRRGNKQLIKELNRAIVINTISKLWAHFSE
ncbi:unnamed protein product, partial [marine sediment metagenome]